jgi:hypothetical protein
MTAASGSVEPQPADWPVNQDLPLPDSLTADFLRID